MWHATSPGSMADLWRERIRAATDSVFPGTRAERWAFVVLLAVVGVVLLANREPADDRPDGGQGSPTARTG